MRTWLSARFPGVRQQDASDCGAACLASVAAFHGLRLPIARIRQYAGTNERGTTLLGLIEAAEKMGFAARGVRADAESLSAVPLPAIAHVVTDDGLSHFVIVYAVRTGRIGVMDPKDGKPHGIAFDEFRRLWTGVLVLLAPAASFRPGRHERSRIGRLMALLVPQRPILMAAAIAAGVYALLGLSSAIFVQKVVDDVLTGANRNLLNLLGVTMVIALLAQMALAMLRDLYALRVGQRLDAALISGFYHHLLRLPQSFFDTRRVGEVLSRVSDAVKIRAFVSDVFLEYLVSILILGFSVLLMLFYSWRLTLVVMAVLPIYGVSYWLTNRANRKIQREVMEAAAELESHLVESVSAIGTLRRFRAEEQAELRMEHRLVGLLRGIYGSGRTYLIASLSSDGLGRLLSVMVLWVGAGFVIDRSLSPGTLMSFYALAGFLTAPITRLLGMNRTLQDALIASDRLFEIMDLAVEEGATPRGGVPPGGSVELRGITFRFGGRRKVLGNLNVRIEQGRMTALVGESGSGKSTIAGLLQRLHRPSEGQILIGGTDVTHMPLADLRRHVAVVPQDIHLLSGTVAENIALGDMLPDMERAIDVSRQVGLLEVVDKLPAGFATRIGQNGVLLSGGERQRIAIARALYGCPRIVVMDEGTSALDPVAEDRVMCALESFVRSGGTVLLIAHRLTTVTCADRILVLDEGRIVEEGTHADLMATDGAYRRLWNRQMGVTRSVEVGTVGSGK